MTKKELKIKEVEELDQVAEEIIEETSSFGKDKAVVVALEGELGAGKTTLTQLIGKKLGIKERILSPTFVISKRFPLENSDFENLYHIDVYRVGEGIKDIGLEDFMKKRNLLVIEWADKIRDMLPEETIWVKLDYDEKETRKITINRR